MSRASQMIGKYGRTLEETVSTNSLLMAMCQSEELPEGYVVRALHQTQGRGQQNHEWSSLPGENILLSVLLKPNFIEPDQLFNLNICISLAIKDTVELYFPDQLAIKWSNDIFLNHKKVCGVLIENTICNKQVIRSIIGIGLNIMQSQFHENLSQATSFHLQTQQIYDIEKIYNLLLQNLEKRYIELKSGWHQKQKNEYLKSLYRINLLAKYLINDKEVQGIIKGIDESGKLILEINGKEIFFQSGEIKFIY